MKNLTKLLLLCVLVCTMVAISACAIFIKHEAAADWQSDANGHWHACTASGCEEKHDESIHIFDEGKETTPATDTADGIITYTCTVCGYEKTESVKADHTHTWESEWSKDATHHWHASTCGHEDKDKTAHVFDDGFIEKPATDTEEGLAVYTCIFCGYYYEDSISKLEHKHSFSDTFSFDNESHWYAANCGHEIKKNTAPHTLGEGEVVTAPTEESEGLTVYSCSTCGYVKEEVTAKLPHVHVFGEDDLCRCGYKHTVCEICEKCSAAECVDCKVKCPFTDEDRIVYYAPNKTLGAPEGPDGKNPSDYTQIDAESIEASYVVLENGAHATKLVLPNGVAANSGVSFLNNQNIASAGQAGFNCGIPLIGGETKYIRLHFTNHGDSEITIKYSGINYYVDYGVVELTIKAGETKVAIMKTLIDNNSTGINHQIVFTKDASAGASISIWGEYVADKNLESVSVSVPASKLQFAVGETFSAAGLILKANGGRYSSVYITGNYTTDLDGYVFTAEDVAAGKKTVTVDFAGFTATYEVNVYDHVHNIEHVEKKDPVLCADGKAGVDGLEEYYICKVDGCGLYFTDATGNKVTAAPNKITCHTEGEALPGEAINCVECGAELGDKSMDNWMLFVPPAAFNDKGIGSSNVTLAYGDVNGVTGTFITFAKGTVGSASNNKGIQLQMDNDLAVDNGAYYQHKIPNVSNTLPDGTTRPVLIRFVNYGTEDVTLTFINDTHTQVSVQVTVPAGESVIAQVNMTKAAGYNWFYLWLNNESALENDVKIGMCAYAYIYDGEVKTPSILKPATKTEFKVGDTFTAEGLILKATNVNTYGRDLYISTGYTTSLDGYTFTEADAGKVFPVTVSFAGKTCTYNVTVETFQQKVYTSDGYDLNYCLYQPHNIEEGEKLPLILFLHGAGERGNDNKAQLKNAIMKVVGKGEWADSIIIAPQCPADTQWVLTPWANGNYRQADVAESAVLHAAVSLVKEYAALPYVDSSRIYVIGLSMGSFGAWDALARYSDLFAAGVTICGGGPTDKIDVLKNIPIYTFHGTNDTAVPYSGTEAMYNSIVEAGGDKIIFKTYEGAGHNIWDDAIVYAGDGTESYPELESWLFSQKKN